MSAIRNVFLVTWKIARIDAKNLLASGINPIQYLLKLFASCVQTEYTKVSPDKCLKLDRNIYDPYWP